MIITRTPFRLSCIGGGLDHKSWLKDHAGVVLGGAINRYAYITARYLPPFHDYKHRVVYREVETFNNVSELKHAAVRESILKIGGFETSGLELSHLADLPGRSGTGSSSSFVVGLLNALASLQGRRLLPYELCEYAIDVEQNRLKEVVGCQDQAFAAYGGLNVIRFRPGGEINVLPIALDSPSIEELEQHLLLFFTRITRTSSEVAASYANNLGNREREQFAMMRLAEQAIDTVYRKDWETLGKLIDQSWRIKASLSASVATEELHKLYLTGRVAGAFGGKLTGAGGGGCFLFVTPPEKRNAVIDVMVKSGCVSIPFRFDFSGSSVIFADKDNINEYRPQRV